MEGSSSKLGSMTKFRGLTSPNLSPSKGGGAVGGLTASEAEDQFYPIKLIQKMIKDAHYELSEEIEDLLVKCEPYTSLALALHEPCSPPRRSRTCSSKTSSFS